MKVFEKKCIVMEQTKELFPLNDRELTMHTTNIEKYKILHANTERLKNSTVPNIQKMLNCIKEEKS